MPETKNVKPRNRTVPLNEEEMKTMDDLISRYAHTAEGLDFPDPDPKQERRSRLFFVYLLSRNACDFDVSKEWLQWVLTGYNKPKTSQLI